MVFMCQAEGAYSLFWSETKTLKLGVIFKPNQGLNAANSWRLPRLIASPIAQSVQGNLTTMPYRIIDLNFTRKVAWDLDPIPSND